MRIQMTQEEYERKYGVKPVAPQPAWDYKPAPIQMTMEEYRAKYNPDKETKKRNDAAELQEDKNQFRATIDDTISRGAKNQGRIKHNIKSGQVGYAHGKLQQFGHGLATTGELAFNTVVGAGKALLSQETEDKIAKGTGAALTEFQRHGKMRMDELRARAESGNEDAATAAKFHDEVIAAYKEDETFRDDVIAVGGIAEWLVGAGVGKNVSKNISKSVGDVDLSNTVDSAKKLSEQYSTYRTNKAVNKVESDIYDIETSYAKTRKANEYLTNDGAEARNLIAQADVLGKGDVDVNGTLRTTIKGGPVDKFYKEALAGYEDVVRRTLVNEGKTINLKEIEAFMIQKISSTKGLEGSSLTSALSAIEKELKGLAIRGDSFGDIPLEKIHDTKIATAKHIDFNTPAETKTFKKAFAKGLKEIVENKSDADVKKVNKELAKRYQALEKLQDLDGRKVEGGRLGKHTAAISGNLIGLGAGVAGGPVTGAIGAMLGGVITRNLKGKSMSRTFKGTGSNLPDNPILRAAKELADEKKKLDLRVADKAKGVPKGTPKTKTAAKLEAQIKKNVANQKKAIKLGDFELVKSLKKVYVVLVEALKKEIKFIKDNLGSESGKVRFFGGGKKRDAQYTELVDALGKQSTQLARERAALKAGTHLGTKAQARASIDKLRKSNKEIQKKINKYTSGFDNLNRQSGHIGKRRELGSTLSPEDRPLSSKNLTTEAKKYKSADEFVKAQGLAYPSKKYTVVNANAELVKVDDLWGYREFDRRATPMPLKKKGFLDDLKADIKENGIKEPLILEYGAKDGKLILGEGNHRLVAAKELGLERVPVRVVRNSSLGKGVKAPSKIDGDKFGYITADLKPSDVGLKSIDRTQLEDIWNKANKPTAKNLTTDPPLKTNRAVPMKDVAGQKFNVPEGTVIKPRINEKGQAVIKVNGKEYKIAKNQYDNLKGQSTRSVAEPFAPELDGMEVSVRTETNLNGRSFNLDEQKTMATKYDQYTLPGGEDYREIIVQAPKQNYNGLVVKYQSKYGDDWKKKLTTEERTQLSNAEDGNLGTYKSSHWDETNPIFHLRMNDRTWNGKKVTFMEEAQSDWAREGREKGFEGSAELKALQKESAELTKKKAKLNEQAKPYLARGEDAPAKILDEHNFVGNRLSKVNQAISRLDQVAIPNHPLLKNWQVPATKKALLDAVDRDSKVFAWINGAQTSERYKLSTQVNKVTWDKNWNNNEITSVNIYPKDQAASIIVDFDKTGKITNTIGKADWKGKKLDEVLGKGMADSIMSKKSGTLEGEGLNFGGEWANNLYDRQVRDIVKKLTGAEVKKADMGLGSGKSEQFAIDSGSGVKKLTPDRLKEKLVVTTGSKDYLVTKVLGNGKFKAVDAKWAKQLYDIDNIKNMDEWFGGNQTEFDISVPPQTQQYIELTPEVKAKIKSEAPKLKMKNPSAGEALPLIFLLLGGGTVATQG